jgi:acyl carrier protein
MNTLETLQDILVRDYQVARARLTPDAPLNAVGIDSLGFLELLFKIEDRFHVKITGDTPTGLHTVQDVVGYIDALIADRPAVQAQTLGAQIRNP